MIIKILILLCLSFNCLAFEDKNEKISVGQIISACKNGNDSICNGINNVKKKAENVAYDNIPKPIIFPTITILNILSEKQIKIKKTLIDNDQVVINPKRIEYQVNFSF